MSQLICNSAFNEGEILTSPEAMIESSVRNDTLKNLILIFPTNRLVRKYQTYIANKYFEKYKKPVPPLSIYSLNSFFQFCFKKLDKERKYRLISDAYRMSLFEEAAEKAALSFFLQDDQNISTVMLQRLSNIIYGLKEDGISSENLRTELDNSQINPTSGVDASRLSDVVKLYEQYQIILEDKFLDIPELLKKLHEKLISAGGGVDVLFKNKPNIFLHGFSEFKQPEIEIISLFANSSIPLAIHLDYSTSQGAATDNGPLFGNFESNILHLTANGFRLKSNEYIAKNTKDDLLNLPCSVFLRHRLFNTESDIKNPNFSGLIKILITKSKVDEVISISKLIRYLHIKEKIPLSEMCVTMRHPESYATLFREYFSVYEIPANISDRFSLANSPVVASIFAILDLVLKGYRRKDLQKVLQSPYLSFKKKTKDGSETKINASNIINVSQNLRITGGEMFGSKKVWIGRLSDKIKSLKNIIQNLNDFGDSDIYEINRLKAELSSVEAALEDFKFVSGLLGFENKNYTPSDFAALIKTEIIKKLCIEDNLMDYFYQAGASNDNRTELERNNLLENIERDARAFTAFINLLDEMVFVFYERQPGKTFKLEKLIHTLKTSVLAEKYQIREKQDFGVTVTAIEQIRGIRYKVLILCGAVDGEFPMTYRLDAFLGKDYSDSGKSDSPEEKHIRSEKIHFYQFLTNNPEALDSGDCKIYITYPKAVETEENIRSPFIDALLKITTLQTDGIVDLTNIESEKITVDNKFYYSIASKGELLSYTAAQSFSQKELQDFIDEKKLEKIIEPENIEYINKFSLGVFNEGKENPKFSETDALTNIDYITSNKNDLYSISNLDTYAACPFQYFSKTVLNLPEPKKYELSLSPMEQGNLLHKILFRFYYELQSEYLSENKIQPLGMPVSKDIPAIAQVSLNPEKYDKYKEKLFKIAHEEFEKIRFNHTFFQLEEDELFGRGNKKGFLELWLKAEFKRENEGWDYKAALFEFSFGIGSKTNPYKIEPIKLDDNFYLRGKIDRIEFLDSETGLDMLIADYKSSSSGIQSDSSIKKGKTFQMPLYLYSAAHILKKYYSINVFPAGAVYYILKPKLDNKATKLISHQTVILDSKNHLLEVENKRVENSITDMEAFLNLSVGYAKEIVKSISESRFPVQPASPAECKFCGYKSLCRINERKMIFSDESEEWDES
ncbi:MAG: PD-(D/E)XK nuclease family protein [Bacteroidota bacterium]